MGNRVGKTMLMSFRSPQRMSLSGVKRTCPFALHMSASDPKRTSRLRGVQFWLDDRSLTFGGKAALTFVPRSSSSAMVNALSFFSSGGM